MILCLIIDVWTHIHTGGTVSRTDDAATNVVRRVKQHATVT